MGRLAGKNLKTKPRDAEEAATDDAGLKVSGAHASIHALEKNLNQVLDENAELQNTTVICPWMPEDRRKDAAGWKQCAVTLSKIGRACHERGFDFGYHNHSFEFQKFDGKTGMDILFDNCEPHLVRAEVDVYWVKHGGEDPVTRIDKLGNRVILLHLKDMAAGPDQKFAPVGTGILDFKAILDAASKLGVKYGAVEQDNCYELAPLDAIRISYQNLQKLGAA